MELVQLGLRLAGRYLAGGLALEVLRLQIIVVEVSIQILVVVHPRADHMRVLFSKVSVLRLAMHQDGLVIAEVIGSQRLVAPEHHLAPQVGVLAAVVHGRVGLEILFNIQFVLFKGQLDQFGVCVLSKNFVEIPAHSVLLFVEPIEVRAADGVHMLSQQLPEHAPAQISVYAYL